MTTLNGFQFMKRVGHASPLEISELVSIPKLGHYPDVPYA